MPKCGKQRHVWGMAAGARACYFARNPSNPAKAHNHVPRQPQDRRRQRPERSEGFWMPFTANRAFKARPRMIARAKDMHYYTPEGRPVLDGAAGPVVHQCRA